MSNFADSGCFLCRKQKVCQDKELPKIEDSNQDLLDAANNGDYISCFKISKILIEKTPSDIEHGIYYLMKAVDSEYGKAILYYSELLYYGTIIPKNEKKAKKYLKTAIKKGIPGAYKSYSKLYFNSKKFKKGLEILQKCIKKNDSKSMIYLSQLYQDGIIVNQDNTKAFEILKKAHELKNPKATYLLAEAYRKGSICEKNIEEAVSLHKENADNGNAYSSFAYAEMLEKENEIEKNIQESAKYYEIAANEGNSEACFRLSQILMNGGENIERNKKKANEYLDKAVEYGNPDALYKKALLLKSTKSIENQQKAKEYFQMSALYSNIESEMCYADILIQEEEYERALSYLLMAHNRKHPKASVKLAFLYLLGIGCTQDFEKSFQLFKDNINEKLSIIGLAFYYYIHKNKELSFVPLINRQFKENILIELKNFAKEQDDFYIRKQTNNENYALDAFDEAEYVFNQDPNSIPAQVKYGSFLYFGFGCPPNPTAALPHIANASMNKNPEAMLIHGIIYQKGEIVDQDLEKAADLFKQSSNYSNVEATFFYAVALLNGSGVQQNYEQAADYFKKAADFNNVPSMYIYASLLENGIGVQPNYEEAASYYLKAANKDHAESMLKYALFCYEGLGVQKNVKEASKWFIKADNLGNKIAKNYHLFLIIKDEISGEKNDAITELTNLKENGDLNASYLLGCCYENGYFYDKNFEEAKKIYRKLAIEGDDDSICKMIEFDQKGINNENADFYKEKKSPLMKMYYGAKCLENGNKKEGLELIRQLSNENYPNSMILYAKILLLGEYGVTKDFSEGLKLIDESSKQFPSIDCIDTTVDTIDFSTHIVFDMHYNPYDPDPNISEPIDWIRFIGDTIFNALELQIDSIEFIPGKGLHNENRYNICKTKQIVLIVTKLLGFDSYIEPRNDGRIICPISSYHEFEDEEDVNGYIDNPTFKEIKEKFPKLRNNCIEIIIANKTHDEAIQLATEINNGLDFERYENRKQNDKRLLNENEWVNYFSNKKLDKEIIKRVVKENDTKDEIKNVLERIDKIPKEFLSDFSDIVANYQVSINYLLNMIDENGYDKNKIIDVLGEKSIVCHSKFLNLKKMGIYNEIRTNSYRDTPKFAPLIEIDLRNADFDKASRSIKRIMDSAKYEKYWELKLLFSLNTSIQKCNKNEIINFIKNQSGYKFVFRTINMDYLNMEITHVKLFAHAVTAST